MSLRTFTPCWPGAWARISETLVPRARLPHARMPVPLHRQRFLIIGVCAIAAVFALSVLWTPAVAPALQSDATAPIITSQDYSRPERIYFEPEKPSATGRCLRSDLSSLANGSWTFSGLSAADISLNESSIRQFRYRSNGCEIRRVGVDEARSCMRDKHIVFLGDSLLRQQFSSLIIFLETGAPAVRFINATPGIVVQDAEPALLFPPLSTHRSGCGTSFLRCDGPGPFFDPSRNGEECNRYYFNPKHNLNVSLLGYYAAGCGRQPVRSLLLAV